MSDAQLADIDKSQGFIAYLIFLQSFVGVIGSMYMSSFGDPLKNLLARNLFPVHSGLIPCELCWYARILLFPLVIISIVGMIKEDRRYTDYILPFSILGIFLEAYQYGLQKFNFANIVQCSINAPCSAIEVQYFGFITIPFLAFLAFLVITMLCLLNMYLNQKRQTC